MTFDVVGDGHPTLTFAHRYHWLWAPFLFAANLSVIAAAPHVPHDCCCQLLLTLAASLTQ
jgi:hypothetical protein